MCNQCVTLIGDDKSICDKCENFKPLTINWKHKANELRQIITEGAKGAGKYEVMVPLSGGKDSSFVLYYMSKVLKLRVLAVTWDNYLMADGAWENIHRAVESAGADLKICKWEPEIQMSMYRTLFMRIGRICYCLQWMKLFFIPIAVQERIPFIITGESEGQRNADHSFELPDERTNRANIVRFYSIFRRIMLLLTKKYDPKMKNTIRDEVFGPMEPIVKNKSSKYTLPIFIPLANYVDWTNKNETKKIIEKELNWKNPTNMFLHTNCWFEPIKGYMEHKKHLNESRYELSSTIRSGGITREEAVEETKKMCLDGTRPDEQIARFCKLISISESDFDKYIIRKDVMHNPILNWAFSKVIQPKAAKMVAWHFGLDESQSSEFSPIGIGTIK